MRTLYIPLVFAALAAVSASAQHSATITVTDLGSGMPVENATVSLDGNFIATDPAGQAIFPGLADDTYDYSVFATCYNEGSGSVTIAGADGASSVMLDPLSTNNVFFFIGDPLAITGATVQVTDGADYNASFVTSDPFGGEILADVPYGDISYTISAPCYATVTGMVTVDCNNGDGIAVFENPAPATTNNVFFFIGDPLAITGATVQVTDGADYNASFVTSDPFGGEILADVPYGDISYTISAPCYATVTGTVTVDCNNGDGIAVFENPAPATTNNVFFFIGDPLAITGATVQVTDGADYNASFVTSDPFGGEILADVPYGDISYTISAPCYATLTGTVTVDCNNGDGIAVFENPAPATTNNVFFFIGDPLAITGATVQVTDGADYNASFVTSDPFGGEMLADVPFGDISYTISAPCYATLTGTVTVDCNNGDGIAVFENPAPATTNNVFFFIGDPLAITGATVQVTDGADYNASFVTTDTFGGEMLADVPFGDISYTITAPCYATVTGTVTVDCNNGDGIAIFTDPAPVVIDVNVTLTGSTLTATATGVGYQWVDCDNNNAPIVGAEGQNFLPAESGDYAVVLTSGDCSQTSACTEVIVTGVDELAGRDAFAVYPNPFGDRITVSTNGKLGPVRLELLSLTGQVLLDETRSGMEISLQTSVLPSGSYILRMSSDNARSTVRVVK
ncbi:MAG: T9SS type A sorting domain-containing protein [Flavobacteriales bacterium]|nr:T9SS type A sorting domain-containing protein [Flavobacteriales bacterium]